VKRYWEIIADNLKKRGWSLGWVSAVDSRGRTIFVADAHRDDGKRFIVRADEILTAFLELESAIRRVLADKATDDEVTKPTNNANHPYPPAPAIAAISPPITRSAPIASHRQPALSRDSTYYIPPRVRPRA
jgi:hypothetical protein